MRKAIFAIFVLLVVGLLAQAPASASEHQIRICHATGNPGHYSMPIPTKQQISEDHGHTNGSDEAVHVGDIIPSFEAGSHGGQSWEAYPGLNWDEEGQAIWANGCEIPATTTTTAVETTTTTEGTTTTDTTVIETTTTEATTTTEGTTTTEATTSTTVGETSTTGPTINTPTTIRDVTDSTDNPQDRPVTTFRNGGDLPRTGSDLMLFGGSGIFAVGLGLVARSAARRK